MTAGEQALHAHLQGEVTSVCHCWQVTRKDGIILGFTDSDSPVEFAGVTHEPDSGFSSSRHQEIAGFAAANAEIEGALSSARINVSDIHAGQYDGARVETWLVNWKDPAMRRLLRVASIARITVADGSFIAELESVAASLDGIAARLYQRNCDAELGDERCGVSLEAAGITYAATVTALHPPHSIEIIGLDGLAGGWCTGGTLEWLTGERAGLIERVEQHRSNADQTRLRLEHQELSAVAAGDTVRVTAGCDKRFATCRDKFANALNFRGFPHLPGNDVAYGYVVPDMKLDGKPVVP